MSISLFSKRIAFTKSLLRHQKRYGYVVLVPEIGDDLPDNNPLLRPDGLPEFNNITIEKCVATVGKQAIDVEKTVQNFEETVTQLDKAENKNEHLDVFESILNPLEKIEAQLETTWGLAKCLYLGNSTLMPTKSYMQINERARKARYAKFSSPSILKAVTEAAAKPDLNLTDEQKRLLGKYALEGKLNGVQLNDDKKAILMSTMDKLKQEQAKFQGKLDVSTRNFVHTIHDYTSVRDYPTELLQTIATDPLNHTKGPWKITLQPNVYPGFMENCPDRTLRWNVWQAYNRRSSGYADKNLSNSIHIEEIRFLRHTQANLLGFKSFVDMSMETKMAGNVDHVRQMIENLLAYSKPAQETEIKQLQQFAEGGGLKGNLELYDIPYWKRKQLKSAYNYDDEVIREYFPLPNVLSGLFDISEKLFQIKIVERTSDVDTWQEDVQFYDVFDVSRDGSSANPIAGFYLDLYSREDEKTRVQGQMVGIRNRCRISDNVPLSALMFNFPIPLYGKPSLLQFNDVQTLFSKFGHSLQHLLTQANYSELAGLSNIEWDAVEVCGHVMSHLLYHQNTIKSISSHYANEATIPDELVTAIQERRKHMAGFLLSHELYLASLDLELYSKKDFWLDILKGMWSEYNVLPLDKKNAHLCSMAPIFSGNWAAAYYSHIWSRLIAADVYSAFYEAQGTPNEASTVGKRFRETYLALGGSCHSSEVFRRFRGRDPSPKALLKTLGLYKAPSNPPPSSSSA